MTTVKINNKDLEMELGTGATRTIISETIYRNLFMFKFHGNQISDIVKKTIESIGCGGSTDTIGK